MIGILRKSVSVAAGILLSLPALYCQHLAGPPIPSKFKLDFETAARLRPELLANSESAAPRYATGEAVFQRLIEMLQHAEPRSVRWELRIIDQSDLNAYSSPDGLILVSRPLGDIAGDSPGLWSAILSHEIAHVVRRDWARRYLFQKSLETRAASGIVLGDPGIPEAQWTDAHNASAELGRFCRQLELDADRDALTLMAKAGFHPHFAPALHHLLHARTRNSSAPSLYAMHPCWEERDRDLMSDYGAAAIEFQRHWPEWNSSPGGNPPTIVFAEQPRIRKIGPEAWEIQVSMRCQNLFGTIEIVLHDARTARAGGAEAEEDATRASADDDTHQLTGCTSPRTFVTFSMHAKAIPRTAEIYVLDAWGAVLARTDALGYPE